MSILNFRGATKAKLVVVVLLSMFIVSTFVYAQQKESPTDSGSSQGAPEAWPEIPQAASDHYTASLPEEVRSLRGISPPSSFSEDSGVLGAQILYVIRYGQYRVGTAYPWLVEQSKDLWSTPLGISACFSLLYFGDTSGIRRLQENAHSIMRSPQHWFCVSTAGLAVGLFQEWNRPSDRDFVADLLLRQKERRPAPNELTTALMALDDQSFAKTITRLDNGSLVVE